MSLASSRTDEIERWTGRLLGIAGVVLLVEFANGVYREFLGEIPFSWLLSSIPFGIGFVLIPFVLFRSYQSLVDRTPTAAIVGSSLVAVLPVGAIILVAWAVLALTIDFVPEVSMLPITVSTVFFGLLAVFAVGIAMFGFTFLRHEQTRLLGGSLLIFAAGWALPLAVAKLSGVYPGWLADLLVVSVATSMITIGYCFPPLKRESGW
ncbi:hypothetical protein [Halohasta litorea]|uniref:Uncharacterized protein n=1 Tax=Halohasta litorea TaxID=869891 RepID=A0ABD6DE73_9EURY|nr:hypothetical protein [Halohasta litorea]